MKMLAMRRAIQVAKYGWRHAGDIAEEGNVSRAAVFLDILRCYRRYAMWSNQYKKERFYFLDKSQREVVGSSYKKKNDYREQWVKETLQNNQFFAKYGRYMAKPREGDERLAAYTRQYNIGRNAIVSHDVRIERQHYLHGKLTIGNNVMLSKHVYIDYSGEVVISDDVKLSAGVIIESHRHEFVPGAHEYPAIPTSIFIDNGVWVGQRAVICEDCKRIGRFAQIGAGAVVRNPVPPYAIVVGNPAKIVGFVFTPDEVREFESKNFPTNPTDIVKYEADYKKYFIDRIKEIKQQLKN